MKRKKPELNFLEISFIKKTVSVRKAFGLSQEQVAKKAGVTTGFIAQFESFHHRPTENVVKKIAKGLNYQGLVEEFNEIKKEEKKSGDSNFLIVLPTGAVGDGDYLCFYPLNVFFFISYFL